MERVCSICRDAFAEMPPATATVELPACRHAFCEECLGGWWSACCLRARRTAALTVGASTPGSAAAHAARRGRCRCGVDGAVSTAMCAAPKRQRHVGLAGNDQAVDHEVESSEEEDCEPVSKRRKKCATTSEFVGVSWHKQSRKWRLKSSTMGRSSTWAASTTSRRRREPSTRRRGGCGARTRTADEQEGELAAAELPYRGGGEEGTGERCAADGGGQGGSSSSIGAARAV